MRYSDLPVVAVYPTGEALRLLMDVIVPLAAGVRIDRCVNDGHHAAVILIMPKGEEFYFGEVTRPEHLETIRHYVLPCLRGSAQEQCRQALRDAREYVHMLDSDQRHMMWTLILRLATVEALNGVNFDHGTIAPFVEAGTKVLPLARTM